MPKHGDTVDKGLLAIRLFKLALDGSAEEEDLELLKDEGLQEFKRAWRLSRKLLNADFRDMLKRFSEG
jgi:hypothetical protein